MRFSRGARNFSIGFVALVGGGFAAWQGFAAMQLNGFVMRQLPVTRVNLIAVDPAAGYRIIVANQIAQVVETRPGEDMQAGTSDEDIQESDVSDGERRRLPVKDLLGAMQGDLDALSSFVMILNQMDANELPPDPVVWTMENLEKALTGDATLKTKLQQDLNLQLDGTPLEELRPDALEIGIVIDFPVPITVSVGPEKRTLVARVKTGYIPQFSRDVTGRIQERSEITDDLVQATYMDEASKVMNGTKPKEDVAKSIRGRYSSSVVKGLASAPEKVLNATSVILNGDQMTKASTSVEDSQSGARHSNLHLSLNDEGMKRLWKYSRDNRGFQVLLTVDGIPMAAPRFRNELITHEVTINQLADARIAQDAADAVNQSQPKGTNTQ